MRAILFIVFATFARGADVTLTWTPPADSTVSTRIHYAQWTGGKWLQQSVDAGRASSITISGLADGRTYDFVAAACGSDGKELGNPNGFHFDGIGPQNFGLLSNVVRHVPSATGTTGPPPPVNSCILSIR